MSMEFFLAKDSPSLPRSIAPPPWRSQVWRPESAARGSMDSRVFKTFGGDNRFVVVSLVAVTTACYFLAAVTTALQISCVYYRFCWWF